jgi:hypothetical protein
MAFILTTAINAARLRAESESIHERNSDALSLLLLPDRCHGEDQLELSRI